MNFLQELKKFIVRGNLVDLAVGFTVGAAFTTVAKSVVGDLVMPVVGLAIGRVDFKDLFVVLRPGASGDQFPTVDAAQQDGAVTLNYGLFINNVIALLFVGLVVFLVVRLINRIHDGYKDDDGKDDARPAEPDNKSAAIAGQPYTTGLLGVPVVRRSSRLHLNLRKNSRESQPHKTQIHKNAAPVANGFRQIATPALHLPRYWRIWTDLGGSRGLLVGPVALEVPSEWRLVNPRIGPVGDDEALLSGWEIASGENPTAISTTTDGVFEMGALLDNSTAGKRMRTYEIASNSDGVTVLAGSAPGTMGPPKQIWAAVFWEGEWTPARTMIPDTTVINWVSSAPKAVVSEDGRAVVVWTELHFEGPAPYKFRWIEFNPNDASWSDIRDVRSPHTENAGNFQLAGDGYGNLQVAWTEGEGIWGARMRAGQNEWSAPTLLGNRSTSLAAISLDFNEAGQGILTWSVGSSAQDTMGYNYFR